VNKTTIRITPKGPFSLAASARFLEGFEPASYEGAEGHLHLAFPLERSWAAVGGCVRQAAKRVTADAVGDADEDAVRNHIARIFSLDVDGSRLPSIGERDAVAGKLLERFPGLRPVLFWSPYEAAAWTIIGHRIRMTQAARIKQRMAQDMGDAVDVHGQPIRAFPGPRRLLELSGFPGLSDRKVEQLRALARAALEGRLDAARLRSGVDPALADLKRLPGIGDFSAELILVRGAGEPDYFPRHEHRLHRAMAAQYGLGENPSVETLASIAERWRPYRSWVSLLFRAAAEDAVGDFRRATRPRPRRSTP
jgi:DNA-3-methyladenine glycosylase II